MQRGTAAAARTVGQHPQCNISIRSAPLEGDLLRVLPPRPRQRGRRHHDQQDRQQLLQALLGHGFKALGPAAAAAAAAAALHGFLRRLCKFSGMQVGLQLLLSICQNALLACSGQGGTLRKQPVPPLPRPGRQLAPLAAALAVPSARRGALPVG